MQLNGSANSSQPRRNVLTLLMSFVAVVLSSIAIIRQTNPTSIGSDPEAAASQSLPVNPTLPSENIGEMVDSKIESLREQMLTAMDFKRSQEESAELDVGGRMSSVRSESLGFLVSRRDCEPYLDGQKITLEIGNPHFVTLSEIEMEITYGAREPSGSHADDSLEKLIDDRIAWNRSLKKHRQAVPVDLKPGSWTRVEMIIAPVAQAEVAYLRIDRIRFNRASLYPATSEK